MLAKTFYMIGILHARVHELISSIQLRLHVLSFRSYMSFAVKLTCAIFGTNAMAATLPDYTVDILEYKFATDGIHGGTSYIHPGDR